MKTTPVNLIIAVTVSALLAFGLWSFGGDLKNFVAIGSFAYLSGTLSPGMGISFDNARRATNVRVVCGIFFMLGLGINTFFAMFGGTTTAYILATSISFLTYIFIANAIGNAQH